MSKELIERLRSEWRKPENKPPEMCEAADRIEQLETENVELMEEINALEQQCKVQAESSHHWHGESQVLRQQLAASQAREQQLRAGIEAIQDYAQECVDRRVLEYGEDFRSDRLKIMRKDFALAQQALSTPSDTTALEAMIQKAVEVMREKCIPIHFKQFLSDVHTAAGLLRHGKKDKGLADRLGKDVINYMTQTIPQVTLNDLK